MIQLLAGASVFLALLDIVEDRLHGPLVDDGADVGILPGIAHLDLLDSRFQLLQELVIDALVDDGP